MNLLLGLCLIIALGMFNRETSGHFAMNKARLIIELRPGDPFFNLSAFIAHRNAGIARGEWRQSLVQYTAANIFRWVHNKHSLYRLNRWETEEDWIKRIVDGISRLGNIQQLGYMLPENID